MFVVTSSMFGLVIVSLGILGVVVSFLVTPRKRFLIALSLSGLVVAMGLYLSVGVSLRQWRTARQIAKIQEQNRRALENIQNRVRQSRAESPAVSPAPAPAAEAPVAARQPRAERRR